MSDCVHSVSFVGGCRVHSTLSALLKLEPTTWSEADWIAKEYDLNVVSAARDDVVSILVSHCL